MGIQFGLDLGTNSIGWAVFQTDNRKPVALENMGVRIFQEGVDRTTTGAEQSKNKTRRDARQSRKQHQRRNKRRQRLKGILVKNGMAPSNEEEYRKWINLDPYKLRAAALDRELSLSEIGRALYHLNQRRGYKSNRKSNREEKDGVVAQGISQLKAEMDKVGARTYGEYFNNLSFHDRKRGRYTLRDEYLKEFDLIWEKQSQFHPNVLTDDLKRQIKDKTVFFQRDIHPVSHLIGKCSLEPDKKRCPKARLIFQEARILQQINSLWGLDDTGEIIPLSDRDRKTLLDLFNRSGMNKSGQVTFSKIRKALGWKNHVQINLEEGGRKNLDGNKTNNILAHKKGFGDRWFTFEREKRNAIVEDFIYVDSSLRLKEHLIDKWECSEEEAEYLSDRHLEDGYASFSHKALRNILPYLKEGLDMQKAKVNAGYELTIDVQKHDFLPKPPRLPNPIVNQGLIELRKVINNLIRSYGKPELIRLELARDVKRGKEARDDLNKRMRQNQKKNEEAKKALVEEFGIEKPSGADIIWYKLWQECGCVCPYSGKIIVPEHLNSGEVQVEHILPFSKSLDDSYMNKTLCFAEWNARKGNETPFKAFSKTDEWEHMLQRIRKLPHPKKERFIKQEIEGDFIQRQLNDTRYISTEAKKYLAHVCDDIHVASGKITHLLRKHWHLNGVLNPIEDVKTRDDHRHHAVDAVVVGLAEPRLVQKLSRAMATKGEPEEPMPLPWSTLREDVERLVGEIVVSHRPKRGISNALHEDTNYGITGETDEKDQKLFVTRKPVHVLSEKEIGQIRDLSIELLLREELEYRKAEHTSFNKAIASFETNPLILPDKNGGRPVRRVRLIKPLGNVHHFKDSNGDPYRVANYGNNHHIELYRYTDKKGRKKQKGYVMTMMEAAQRAKENLPLIDGKKFEDAEFFMALHANDMVIDKEGQIYRVQKIDGVAGVIHMRLHTVSLSGQSDPGVLRKSSNTFDLDKIEVDPIGNAVILP